MQIELRCNIFKIANLGPESAFKKISAKKNYGFIFSRLMMFVFLILDRWCCHTRCTHDIFGLSVLIRGFWFSRSGLEKRSHGATCHPTYCGSCFGKEPGTFYGRMGYHPVSSSRLGIFDGYTTLNLLFKTKIDNDDLGSRIWKTSLFNYIYCFVVLSISFNYTN